MISRINRKAFFIFTPPFMWIKDKILATETRKHKKIA